MPGALTGNPWVPSSPSSYDHSQPERFNLAPSFHARAKYETQVHHPPRDAFDAIIAVKARGTPMFCGQHKRRRSKPQSSALD